MGKTLLCPFIIEPDCSTYASNSDVQELCLLLY